MRQFDDPELQREYDLERVRELARADMAMENPHVRNKNIDTNQKLFIYTIVPYILMTCFVIIMELFIK